MDAYLGQTKDIMLGQDFLTWLWFKSETTGGTFRSAEGIDFAMYMEQRVSVQGGEGENLETASVSGAMSELREARLGLAVGKKVNKALLRIERDEETWQVSLKAEDFTLHSLKTPSVEKAEEDDEPDAPFLEKMFLVERCMGYIDDVYAQFLALRLSSGWQDEVANVREWLKQG